MIGSASKEQELRALRDEATKLCKRIDAALERKPKYVRNINGSVDVIAGKWYRLKEDSGKVWFMDEGCCPRWPPDSSPAWEFSYDDTPPAEELLPCPECNERISIVLSGGGVYICYCGKCGLRGPSRPTREAAIRLHNWMASQLHGMKEH